MIFSESCFRCLYLLLALFSYCTLTRAVGKEAHDDWGTIRPARYLDFVPCYLEFECARLQLPLDWASAENDSSRFVTLAMIRLPVQVSRTDQHYGGAIIVNPGGPGMSGVEYLKTSGRAIQSSVSTIPKSDGRQATKQFDIVSFDPRGIGHSTPNALCFDDDMQRQSWTLQTRSQGNLDRNEDSRRELWARAKAFGSFCGRRAVKDDTDIRRHMGTASVARDMLHMIDLLDEERNRHLPSTLLGHSLAEQKPMASKPSSSKKPGIKYWGFSYGTVLGMTFASLFPDRVDSMALDGVVDLDDYMTNGWEKNLLDTEEVFRSFCRTCHRAGPRCPLFDVNGVEAIEKGIHELYKSLRKLPLSGVIEEAGMVYPATLTYSDFAKFMFSNLYHPRTGFSKIARGIDELRQGNLTRILMQNIFVSESLTCSACSISDKQLQRNLDSFDEAGIAILCGDGDDKCEDSLIDFEAYLQILVHQSLTAGAIWARLRLACTGWQVRSKWRLSPSSGVQHNLSAPILFMANTRDPVTPLSNALNMAEKFSGSVVLEQNCDGHCSAVCRSECTEAVIFDYFQSGKLPLNGTVCEGDALSLVFAQPQVGVEKQDRASISFPLGNAL